MQAVSPLWEQAVRSSHHVSSRVQVATPPTAAGAPAEVLVELPVESGQVTLDAMADTRGHVSLTAIDEDGLYTPATLDDVIAVNGNELRVWSSIAWPGPADLIGEVSLGIFPIADVNISNDGSGAVIQVEGYDRARAVTKAGFESLFPVPIGTNSAQAIIDILLTRVPWLPLGFDASITDQVIIGAAATDPPYTSQTYTVDDDPWQKAKDIAASFGRELYLDPHGVVQCMPLIDPEVAVPVWTYQEGAGATLLGASKKWSDENTASGVTVVSTSTDVDPPISLTVWDDDPLSPTYYLGKFGRRVRRVESALVTDRDGGASLELAAKVYLSQYKGLLEDVQFTAITNPAHQVGDAIIIESASVKVQNKYVLQTLTIPLGQDGDMTATTRLTRVGVPA